MIKPQVEWHVKRLLRRTYPLPQEVGYRIRGQLRAHVNFILYTTALAVTFKIWGQRVD